MNLLTTQNAKTSKGEEFQYLTGILYLKPFNTGGYKNVCPKASEGCKKACLNTAGRGRFDRIQNGRQRKTDLYFNQMDKFFDILREDLRQLQIKAKNKGLIPCVRLNGTSDLPSLARKMAKEFPHIQFYDYTKLPNPHLRVLHNYHLTFSKSENNWLDCVKALENGINVAVVFNVNSKNPLPKTYRGFKVLDGDKTDLRFVDKKGRTGYIVGLKAKGDARKDKSGFVVFDA